MRVSPVDEIKAGSESVLLKQIKSIRKHLLHQRTRTPQTTGNRVTPFIDGPAVFAEAEKMIKSADSAVQLEMYTLNHPKMVELLCEKAQSGKQVQVVLDPSNKDSEAARQLQTSGAEVVYFAANKKRGQIDHIKMLLVDGKAALMGGMNWSSHSPVNHDADIKIEGPAVVYYRKAFEEAWKKSGGGELPVFPTPRKLHDQNAKVLGIAADNFQYTGIRDSINENIAKAKKSIHLEAFILSDRDVIAGLIEAKKRGVEVQVLLDPTLVGTPFSSNDKTMKYLTDADIEARWYTVDKSVNQKLHAKWAAFDEKTMIIGSANLSFKGLNVNREIGAEVDDKTTVSAFEKQFREDWETRSAEDRPIVGEECYFAEPVGC